MMTTTSATTNWFGHWYRILWPLGFIYSLLMKLRRWLYRKGIFASQQLPGVVISVGNLEVGGTGKSPMVQAIGEYLSLKGYKVAVLTRGFKSGLGRRDFAVLVDGKLTQSSKLLHKLHADEALMQSNYLPSVPIIIGSNRFAAAKAYLTKRPPPDIWILDDGFQHLRIKRDIDVVLLDDSAPFDSGFVLPSGRLRESPKTLKHADLVALTRAGSKQKQASVVDGFLKPGTFKERICYLNPEPYQIAGPYVKTHYKGLKFTVVLGIAKPQSLLRSLADLDVNISSVYIAADHQTFDAAKLKSKSTATDAILTTSKDYFRDKDFFTKISHPVYIVPLKLDISEEFLQQIQHKLEDSIKIS